MVDRGAGSGDGCMAAEVEVIELLGYRKHVHLKVGGAKVLANVSAAFGGEPGERVTLHAHFNRGILRGLEPKKIDVQMLHRNPPRLGEMLGEDDWFDKLTAAGRDHVRAAYMARLHQFSEARKQELLRAAG